MGAILRFILGYNVSNKKYTDTNRAIANPKKGESSMRLALPLAAVLAGLSLTVYAADEGSFKWSDDKFAFVASGDAEKGKALAKKYKCKRCHNADGISDDPEIPSIAGQRATYMYKQMHDYKAGVRENRDMKKATRRMSEEDLVHVAAWYSSLESAPAVGGKPLLQVKICDSCHDKDIVEKDGDIEVAPVLHGQVPQYLEAAMAQFRTSDRSNDLFDRMQSVSHKLTEEEIRQLALYYGAEPIVD